MASKDGLASVGRVDAATQPQRLRSARPADVDYDALAEEVARLRGEIESLDAKLEDQQDARRSTLRSLSAQRNGLEADIRREELRIRQLEERLARTRQRSSESKAQDTTLALAVADAALGLLSTLDGAIPFEREERRQTLEAVVGEVKLGSVPPSAAVDRLWGWVDEELKLARENSIHPQVIRLESEDVLAEVAHLGMIALYFRTPERRYGFASRQGDEWIWVETRSHQDIEQIEVLFRALSTGPLNGFFELPGQAIFATDSRPPS